MFTICVCFNDQKNFDINQLADQQRPQNAKTLTSYLIFVDIVFQKKIVEVLDPYQVPYGRNFKHLEKIEILKSFERVLISK